jgi:fumarate hydratase class II
MYGPSTKLAIENFPISGHRLPEAFVRALGLVKFAAAVANGKLQRLSADKSQRIQIAAREVADGTWTAQFPIDVFQTGSATSTNMNANEVIATRANALHVGTLTDDLRVHPNDDVNLGQSSNDVIPSVLHISVAVALHTRLVPALEALEQALDRKCVEFGAVVKIGRTHLMDATPLLVSQELSGYRAQATKSLARVRHAIVALEELAIGGTAVGTGINGDSRFAPLVCGIVSEKTGLTFREAADHFEAQGTRDDCTEVAGVLTTVAASVTKIANDIRWMGSGPRAGLAELRIPELQPGSSIMPGKANPVMSEMLVQVGLYTHGLMQTVMMCGREGQFELNTTLPLIAHCLHEAVHCLSNGITVFADRCIDGLQVDAARCRALVDQSLMLATALNPHLGYDGATKVAREAMATGKTLREVVLERGLLDAETLDAALDPLRMTKPQT